MNYSVVRYDGSFKGAVAALQTHSWSVDSRLNLEYLQWKHERNPYLESPLIYLALHGGRLVGMRGFYGSKWEIGGGERIVVPCASDLVVDPEHRNRGLHPLIMKHALEGLAAAGHSHVFSLSASPVTLLDSLAMGWKSAGSLEELRRIGRRQGDPRAFHRFIRRLRLFWRRAAGLSR